MINVDDVEKNVKAASGLLKALSNEKRLLILAALHGGEKCVGDLEDFVNLSQSALSQHLARLRRDHIVQTRREAQTIYYSIRDPAAESVLGCICDIYSEVYSGDKSE